MGATWPSTQGQEEVGILWGTVKWGRGEVRGALAKDGWGRELRGPLYLISFKNNRSLWGFSGKSERLEMWLTARDAGFKLQLSLLDGRP